MNKKAFTLMELLAVIIILGLLMAIAIPSVTAVLESSRRNTYIATTQAYVNGLASEFTSNNINAMYDEDTVYYVPFSCIPLEKGGQGPTGDWEFGYVMTTFTNQQRDYYIFAKDQNELGVLGIDADQLKAKDIKMITQTENDVFTVGGKSKIAVIYDNCDFENATSIVNVPTNSVADACYEISASGAITDFYYENYGCGEKNLKIDSIIKGISVSSINEDVFWEIGLETLSLPNSLTKIGAYSFNSNNLKAVSLPDSIKEMGMFAFEDNQLVTLKLPENLSELESSVFAYNNLETVSLPIGLKTIGERAFEHNKIEKLTIPSTVEFIDHEAFAWNKLTDLTIPGSVKTVSKGAFITNPLESLTLSEGVEVIEDRAFNSSGNDFNSNNIKTLVIPASVKRIGIEAFTNSNIENLTLKSGLETIGAAAFAGNKFTELSIPATVMNIEQYAFSQSTPYYIYMEGRSSTSGMTLGNNWDRNATVIFKP